MKGKTRNRGRNFKSSKPEKNNWQDKFADDEFDKGYRKGASYEKSKVNRKNGVYNVRQTVPVNTGSGARNDFSWHYPNDLMKADAYTVTTEVSTGNPLNNPVKNTGTVGGTGNNMNSVYQEMDVPGVMTLEFAPSIGYTNDEHGPINEAMRSLLTYIRQDKSGTIPYSANDLGILIVALDSAYMFYEMCCRAYGVARNYNMMNRYTPDVLLNAMHIDAGDLKKNLANFRTWLNNYARQLGSYVVPTGIKYFARHSYMARNIFTDADSAKAQYYVFQPRYYYQFQEGTQSSPMGSLVYADLYGASTAPPRYLTVEEIESFGDALLSPIAQSDTYPIIMADILTKFSGSGVVQVAQIDENYIVQPVYDKEALVQIENSRIIDQETFMIAEGSGVTQVEGINNSYLVNNLGFVFAPGILSKFAFPSGYNVYDSFRREKVLFNFHTEKVTEEDVAYASFLNWAENAGYIDEDDPLSGFKPGPHGSEIITGGFILLYKFKRDNDKWSGLKVVQKTFGTDSFYWIDIPIYSDSVTGPNALNYVNQMTALWKRSLQELAIISNFDWCPQVTPVILKQNYKTTPTSGLKMINVDVELPFLDIDNFVLVDDYQIQQMHRCNLLGLFMCRDMGSYSKEVMA